MELLDKLAILADAAKYDAACTSSGLNRQSRGGIGHYDCSGLLPLIFGRRAVCYPAEGPADQPLRIRLSILYQPPLQRCAPNRLHASRIV